MALKPGYGIFLLWSYSSGAVVQTFTSTMITAVTADYTIYTINTHTGMTYHAPFRETRFLGFFFADLGWLKVPAYPYIMYISKKFRYRKINYV